MVPNDFSADVHDSPRVNVQRSDKFKDSKVMSLIYITSDFHIQH